MHVWQNVVGSGLRSDDWFVEGRDEAAMIASILAGDLRQFHELIRPFERSVYLMALSMLRNEAEAEEVAQEAFLKAFRNLATFRADSKFSTWLISITLNEARQSGGNRLSKMESLDACRGSTTCHSSPLARLAGDSVGSFRKAWSSIDFAEAIEELPEIYREVFVLRDVEEMSVNEVAEAMGVSAVKVRLHRARIMLQKPLVPELKSLNPAKRRWLPWS